MTDKLLTIDELAAALGGLGRASIYRHIKKLPGFPRPMKVGAATRFRQSEVQAFIRGDHLSQEEVQQTENGNGGARRGPQKH
jgi:predicted DNA-binding transcriptional regulator AlpA